MRYCFRVFTTSTKQLMIRFYANGVSYSQIQSMRSIRSEHSVTLVSNTGTLYVMIVYMYNRRRTKHEAYETFSLKSRKIWGPFFVSSLLRKLSKILMRDFSHFASYGNIPNLSGSMYNVKQIIYLEIALFLKLSTLK